MKPVLSLYDFLNRFPSEDKCFQYLVEKRWPDGFRCPNCDNQKAYFIEKQRRFQCTVCRHQTSVTAGTVFHRLRHPLLTLFRAVCLVAAAVETDGKTMGRAYLETIDSATTDNLTSFISRNLTPCVKVTSDNFKAYSFLSYNFRHVSVNRSMETSDDNLLPKVHIVIANLKMWLRGTYNCLPSKHLQKYLDEFIFRFNRRWNLDNIFDKLLVRSVSAPSFTYADLTG